jgi:hypothetical protein
MSRVETAKHFGLDIAGRALLHHSDLVGLFPSSVVKGLFSGCTEQRHLAAVASADFEKAVVVQELVYFHVDKGNQPTHVSGR